MKKYHVEHYIQVYKINLSLSIIIIIILILIINSYSVVNARKICLPPKQLLVKSGLTKKNQAASAVLYSLFSCLSFSLVTSPSSRTTLFQTSSSLPTSRTPILIVANKLAAAVRCP